MRTPESLRVLTCLCISVSFCVCADMCVSVPARVCVCVCACARTHVCVSVHALTHCAGVHVCSSPCGGPIRGLKAKHHYLSKHFACPEGWPTRPSGWWRQPAGCGPQTPPTPDRTAGSMTLSWATPAPCRLTRCLSVCPPFFLSVRPSVRLHFCLPVCLTTFESIVAPDTTYVRQNGGQYDLIMGDSRSLPTDHVFVCLPVHLFVCPSFFLFASLSDCPRIKRGRPETTLQQRTRRAVYAYSRQNGGHYDCHGPLVLPAHHTDDCGHPPLLARPTGVWQASSAVSCLVAGGTSCCRCWAFVSSLSEHVSPEQSDGVPLAGLGPRIDNQWCVPAPTSLLGWDVVSRC